MHATLNFGGALPLAQQIEKGASANVFVSADEDFSSSEALDALARSGLVVQS